MTRGIARRFGPLVLVTALAACGGQADQPSEPDAGADGPLFSEADLSAIVLQEDEAPEGTELHPGESGPLTLEELWPSECCAEQQEGFDQAGWQAAHVNVFTARDVAPEAAGVQFALSIAHAFGDADGASRSLSIIQDWIVSGDGTEAIASPGATRQDVDAAGLGEEAFAFSFDMDIGQSLIVYFWRVGNLSLQMRIGGETGSFDAGDVRTLADTMQARAQG